MKISIIGSRMITDYEYVRKSFLELLSEENLKMEEVACIISGGAIGVDKLAERIATEYYLNLEVIEPNWTKHGHGAGIIRNREIIKNSELILAIWDRKSRGTMSSINIAKKTNKKIKVVIYE